MIVQEMRDMLVQYGMSREEVNNIKGKQNLLDKLEEYERLFNSGLSLNDLEPVEEDKELPEDTEYMVPEKGTKAWTEYILSHCYPDELQKGNPTCDGLRRLVEKFIGEIISQRVVSVNTEFDPQISLRSTVVYEVKILPYTDKYIDLNNPPIKVFTEVADSWRPNTPDVFAVHPSATASTRAEGRCYRKALKLTILTAEEMNNDKSALEEMENILGRSEEESSEYITGSQKVLIETRSVNLQIDITKLLNYEFGDKYTDLNQLSRGDAANLVKKINEYQQKGVPEELK